MNLYSHCFSFLPSVKCKWQFYSSSTQAQGMFWTWGGKFFFLVHVEWKQEKRKANSGSWANGEEQTVFWDILEGWENIRISNQIVHWLTSSWINSCNHLQVFLRNQVIKLGGRRTVVWIFFGLFCSSFWCFSVCWTKLMAVLVANIFRFSF